MNLTASRLGGGLLSDPFHVPDRTKLLVSQEFRCDLLFLTLWRVLQVFQEGDVMETPQRRIDRLWSEERDQPLKEFAETGVDRVPLFLLVNIAGDGCVRQCCRRIGSRRIQLKQVVEVLCPCIPFRQTSEFEHLLDSGQRRGVVVDGVVYGTLRDEWGDDYRGDANTELKEVKVVVIVSGINYGVSGMDCCRRHDVIVEPPVLVIGDYEQALFPVWRVAYRLVDAL